MGALLPDRAEWTVSIRMVTPRRLFAMRAQVIVIRPQQSTKDEVTDRMSQIAQALLYIDEAAIEPFVRPHRITRHMGGHEGENQGFELRVFFAAAGWPLPERRWRLGGRSANHPPMHDNRSG